MDISVKIYPFIIFCQRAQSGKKTYIDRVKKFFTIQAIMALVAGISLSHAITSIPIDQVKASATLLDKEITPEAKRSVYIFLLALGVIVLFSICQILDCDIRPNFETGKTLADGTAEVKPLKMNLIIQIVMIAAAACMILFAKAKPKKAVSGAVWQSGMVAVVAIYGIAWLADTYFSNYMTEMQDGLQGIVAEYPWAIAFAFFAVSVLINSQGAVVVAMLPLAYSLGIEGPVLLGLLPSVYGYFFIPNYPSDIATVNFDRSGTTVIGKYLLNHSFMMPGLISVIVSCLVGYGLITIFY